MALGDSCVPMPASLASQCQVYVHIRLSSRLSSQRALSLCLSVCRVITLTHGRLSSRVIGVGTPVLVPDGLTIDDLDNAAAADVGVFLVGLSSTQCTDAGVAFVCAQYFHSCVPVALPDGSSGAWCSWFVVARFEFDMRSPVVPRRGGSLELSSHTPRRWRCIWSMFDGRSVSPDVDMQGSVHRVRGSVWLDAGGCRSNKARLRQRTQPSRPRRVPLRCIDHRSRSRS